jgi:hypothetical protein
MTTGSTRLQSKGVQGVRGVQGEKPGARILSLYSLRLLVLLVLLPFQTNAPPHELPAPAVHPKQ